MPLLRCLVAYAITALAFLALDATWLGVMADRLYRPRLGSMLLQQYLIAPAAAFYLLYLVGLVTFAVAPAFASGRWTTALGSGALLGLVAYATYDLTNQATLKDWPWAVTAADLAWGTVASAVAATIGYLATRWLAARFVF